ncbi:MAG: hypothetical protein HZB99_01985 [Candidatus Harrisonbacteria bacterium]|nr:hypothetical protein [Candidatus Harrisonbacteria bacterium]
MSSNNIYKLKWQKFLRCVWPFRFIPFVDFVFAAGSLATGNMHEESDFDVIVGVRQGRIFTARLICFLIFRSLGWWAKHPDDSKDKLCFNHFVTPNSYRLSPPHNKYWKNLYNSLVPVYGDPRLIQKFYRANKNWMKKIRLYQEDNRHVYIKASKTKKLLEQLLSGRTGDWFEKLFKKIQFEKIKIMANQSIEYKPRIIISDNELEFHPDTRRIELLLKQK